MNDKARQSACECSAAPTLIFACSGAADVGHVTDLAARKLTAMGVGKMFCLAGIGGRISGIMKTTQAASQVLAIDGCPLDCVKHCLEEAGFTEFEHLQLADLDLVKGKTVASDEVVARVTDAAANKLVAG